MRIIQSAPLPQSREWSLFYHGCSKEENGLEILRSGKIKAPDLTTRKGFLKPVEGKVYLTANIDYALIYAIGAALLGVQKMSDQMLQRVGRVGYLFAVDPTDLHDVHPDEDIVGQFLEAAIHTFDFTAGKSWAAGSGPDSGHPQVKFLWENPRLKDLLEHYTSYLSRNMRQKVEDGYMAWQARAGKTAIKKLPDWALLKIVEASGTVAHTGDVSISKAWKLDKTMVPEIRPDGSNFNEVLEEVPLSGH